MPVIHISDVDIERMIDHSLEESPREACGILAGKLENEDIRIVEVFDCENVHANPRHEYFLKPEDQVRIFLDIEEDENMDLVGFYHSHPQGPGFPSRIDASKYFWSGYPMAIVALVPKPSVSFWIWKNDGFQPLEIVGERF